MSPKRRSAERPKLRMDDYSNSDKNVHQKGALDARREIDKVIKKARRDGSTHSAYWTKKLLEVEEKEPDRWHHSGYKELYVDNSHDSSDSTKTGGSPVPKKPRAMYSPSAPTSPLGAPARASRRSSTPSRRADRRSVSSDVRRGSSRSRTDRFSSSARQRSSVSPPSFRRAKSRSPVAAARRSRSPAARRGARSLAARPPSRRSRTASPRPRKLSPAPPPRRGATAKSPMRAARSPAVVARTRSPGSRLLKQDRARNRSIDKVSPSIRRKKSPKVPRYKSPASRSPPSKSPIRRRSNVRSRSPLSSKAARRKLAHKTKYRDSSSSGSRASSSPRRKKNLKQTLSSDMLSSSDCSDSNCSMCKFDKNAKEKRKTKGDKEKMSSKRASPPPEPRLKPRAALPRLPPPMSSSRYARSRSFSIPKASSPPNTRQVEAKQKKKSAKKEKKKLAMKASKAVTTSIIHHKKIKVESPSDESESPSPRRITLSERFGKMAKWNQKKDVESNQRNIRVTAGDHYRVEELDVPLLEPFPEPSPLLLDGSWDDVRVRYAYYKDQGYLEDLSFQDYLKWEEWWYSYQDWLETERLHSLRRRL